MRVNEFLKNPVSVVLYNSIDDQIIHTYIFVGNTPKNVLVAIGTKNKSILADYYGKDYANILCFDNKKVPAANSIAGGNDYPKSQKYDLDCVQSRALTTIKIAPNSITNNISTRAGKPVVMINENQITLVDGNIADTANVITSSDLESCRIDCEHKQFIGADDYDDIKNLLNNAQDVKQEVAPITAAARAAGTTYLVTPQIFPDDTIQQIKEKIYLVTKMPIYRQHIFAIANADIGNVTLHPYNLYAGDQINVDIRQKYAKSIRNMPIDRDLYDARGDIHIESNDQFILAKHWPRQIYCADLNLYVHTSDELLSDNYQFDLIYYGFIIKFWPQLTQEVFRDYLVDETDLAAKYPDLCGNLSSLKIKYDCEQEIIARTYAHCNKIIPTLEIAITRLTAVVSMESLISIRNLFDLLQTTMCVPEIRAYIERDGKQYYLRRRHNRGRDIIFPAAANMKIGIIIAISLRKSDQTSIVSTPSNGTVESEQSRYIFLNIRSSGNYYVHTTWNEEDKFGFDAVMENIHKFLRPVFDRINKVGNYIFTNTDAKLQLPTPHTTKYRGLNISIYWKQQLTTAAFKVLRSSIDSYMKAMITVPREDRQFDKFEFVIKKGTYEYDVSTIDHVMAISNQYSHYSDKTVKLKWDQLYGGRVIRVSNRTTDIRFEVLEVGDNEFKNILMYIAGFIQIQNPGTGSIVNYDKKLKKLRELDPDLYNLKKYGSNKIYSIKCQNKHQPMIYTDDEIANMPAKTISKLTKYWNFTLSKPAYYGCNNKMYPHLSFIAGVHPRGYCMPCCNKKDQNRGIKHDLYQECINNHTYNRVSMDNSRHIMSYGKEIEIGRISKMSHMLSRDIFMDENIYLFGVQQHTLSAVNIGILFAIAEILNITAAEFIDKILVSMNEQLFASIGGSFILLDDLVNALSSILTCNLVRTIEWKTIFIEAARILFDMTVIIFVDGSVQPTDPARAEESIANTLNITIVSQTPSSKYGIVVEHKHRFYPAFMIVPEQFFKSGTITARNFNADDPIIVNIFAVIKFSVQTKTIPIDVAFMINFARERKYLITSLLISMHNQCYAVTLSRDDTVITCPVNVTSYPVGYKLRFEPINSNDSCNIDATRKLIDEINSFVIMGTKYSQIIINVLPDDLFTANTIVTNCGIFRVGENKYIDDINAGIYARACNGDSRLSRLGSAIYNNHLYRLFLLEFVNYIRKDKNTQLRTNITNVILSTNFKKDNTFRAEINNLVSDAADRKKIFELLNRYYSNFDKNKFVDEFNSSQYFFDEVTIKELSALSGSTLVNAIKLRAHNFSVVGTVSDIEFKNIYTACSNNDADYCAEGKLIVPNIDELCDLLAADLQNDLKRGHLFDLNDAVIDYFRFNENPHETISIVRI